MAFNFKDSLDMLQDWGFYDVVLPFILVFVLIFAVLQKTNIFGKESRKYNVIIAMVVGLLFVTASKLVEVVNKMLPIVAVALAVLLGIFMIMGFFGVKEGGPGARILGIIAGGVAIAVGLAYFLGSSSYSGEIFGDISKFLQPYWSQIIIVGIIIGVIAFVASGGKKESAPSEKKPI